MGLSGLGGVFRAMEVSGSGMSAGRLRLEVVASNIANAHTTRTANGEPYRRRVVLLEPLIDRHAGQTPQAAHGVRIRGVGEDQTPFPRVYRPEHPDKDETGHVTMPNVNITHEMVDMITAMRSYEANMKAARSTREMAERALELGRR